MKTKKRKCLSCDGISHYIRQGLCSLCYFNQIEKREVRYSKTHSKSPFLCSTRVCNNIKKDKREKCETCLLRIKEISDNKKRELSLSGLCNRCGSNKFLDSYSKKKTLTRLCQECYLKDVSCRHFDTPQHWQKLYEILKRQDFRCAYTGEILVLGINASVDHILPQKKYPEKAKDVDNIQWVTKDINGMKSSFVEKRFLELITSIYEWKIITIDQTKES